MDLLPRHTQIDIDTLGITFDICNPFEKSISISHLTLQCQYEGSAATSSGPQSSEGNVSVQVQTLEPFECAPLTVRNVRTCITNAWLISPGHD